MGGAGQESGAGADSIATVVHQIVYAERPSARARPRISPRLWTRFSSAGFAKDSRVRYPRTCCNHGGRRLVGSGHDKKADRYCCAVPAGRYIKLPANVPVQSWELAGQPAPALHRRLFPPVP